MDPLNVFISSTWVDMIPEREALEHALHGLRSIRFVGMEYFGSRNESTRQVSLDEVDQCQVYVGVLGHRYGSGITEAEYRRAIERGLPCLIYLKDGAPATGAQPEEDAERLASLRYELAAKHTVTLFRDAHDLTARLVTDLHNLVFDRLIVQGIGQLHADYDSRIQRFLAEYVGTIEAPIAFGGRKAELDALDRWLDDATAPPYAMLGGPAGRGKSALLVHWAQHLALQADISLIYFPISIRFRTNLASVAFASIAARLAALYDEVLPGSQDTPPEVWRELVSTYLHRAIPSGRRFVMILDGADESADWEPGPDLFPAAPPKGLRVLVSARYLAGDVDARGWMARLGWTRPRLAYPFDLSPLTPQGLIDVLHQMSLPLDTLSTRADVVAELYRLTAGDPLLVNLYVADLWARGEEVARLQPEELAMLQPGLDGYFRRWWDDQRMLWGAQSPLREPATNDILNTLACALGPLRTSELLELLPADSNVEFWALDDIMHALQRFVIGDGDVQGYTFSHPRLTDYFYDRLAKAGRARNQEKRFVSWGLACLDKLDSSQHASIEVPGYLLHYLRPHMERTGCDAEDFAKLVSNPWASGWGQLDRGSYSGFLADVARVREVVTREDSQRAAQGQPLALLGAEIRCALYSSSIATLESEMSIDLLKALIAREIWSPAQAISYVTRVPNQLSRLRSLFELIAVMAPSYRPLAVAASLTEIRTLLADEPGQKGVSEVLCRLLCEVNPSSSPAETARLFEAVGHLAQQGLEPQQQSWLFEELRKCAESLKGEPDRGQSPKGSPELVVTVQRALAPFLEKYATAELLSASDDAVLNLASSPPNADISMAAERLSLLRSALEDRNADDAEPWLTSALRAAVQVLTASVVAGATPPEAVGDLLLACWHYVPTCDVIASLEYLAPLLTPPYLEKLLGDIAQWARADDRLDGLTVLLCGVPPELRTPVAVALAVMRRSKILPARAIYRHLQRASEVLSADELITSIDETADVLTPNDQILLCHTLARSRPEDHLRAHLAELALAAIAQLSLTHERLDTFIELLDWLESPGLSDSFEPWRPAPESRLLALPIRQLLLLGKPSRAVVWASAQRLAQRLDSSSLWLPTRMALVAERFGFDPVDDQGTDKLPPSALAASLIERYRTLNLNTEKLAEAAMETAPSFGFADTLLLLRDVATGIPADTVRKAVALVMSRYGSGQSFADVSTLELARIPAIVASGPLYPPEIDTQTSLHALAHALWSRPDADPTLLDSLLHTERMPDVVRHELLAAALTYLGSREDKLGTLLLDVGRLAQPPEDLVGLVLSKLQENNSISPHARSQILERLMPFVKRANLSRWLDHVGAMGTSRLRSILSQFKQTQLLDDKSHWRQIIDAVAKMGSPNQRAKWIAGLVDLLPASVIVDAVGLARGIDDETGRLRALSSLIPLMPKTQRGPLLIEAMAIARRLEGTSEIGRTLVQMVVDLNETSQPLLTEATATAIAISDKDIRGSALAELSALLEAEQLTAAASASRRLEDTAARVRTMKALAMAVVDPTLHKTAIDRILASVDVLPAEGTRGSAVFYLSPLITPMARWPALSSALQSAADRSSGFEPMELLDALSEALPDAPAQLMVQAFVWIRHLPASNSRSHTLASLLPVLPKGLLLPAIVMISEHSSEALVSIIAPYVSAQDLAQAQNHVLRLPLSTRSLLARIAMIHDSQDLSISDRPSLSGPSIEPIDVALSSATSDIQRASILQWLALGNDVSLLCRRHLINAAAQLGDPMLRNATARYLAVLCSDHSRFRASDAVAMIDSAADRALAWLRLALRHQDFMRHSLLEQALAAARSESEPLPRLAVTVEIAIAEPALLESVLDSLSSTTDVEPKASALREMLLRFSDVDSAAIISPSLRLLGEERYGRLIIDVAASLGPIAIEVVLSTLPALRKATTRARLLASLVPHLGNEHQHACVDFIEHIETDFAWIEALGAVTARWPSVLTHERARNASANLLAIGDEQFMAVWLGKAVAYWPETAWPDFLETVNLLGDPALRCDLLCAGIRTCEKKLPAGFLTAARDIDSIFHRCVALGCAGTMSEPANDALLGEALQAAVNSGQRNLYIDTLVGIVEASGIAPPPVFEALLAEFYVQPLRIAQAIRDVSSWLRPDQALRILRVLRTRDTAAMRVTPTLCADLLFDLAPRLATENLPYLIQQIAYIGSERAGSSLLCDLAPLFVDDASQASALAAALSMQDMAFRAQALIGLTECLNPRLQQELLDALEDTSLESERLRQLALVWPNLAPDSKPRWLEAAAQFRNQDFAAILIAHAKTPGQAGETKETQLFLRANPGENDDSTIDLSLDALLDELLTSECQVMDSVTHGTKSSARNPPRIEELVRRLDCIEPEMDRFEELMRSLSLLSDDEMVAVLDVLPQHLAADHQDDVLIHIMGLLPSPARGRVLPAVGRVGNATRLKRVLLSVLPHLDNDAQQAFHSLLGEILYDARRGSRRELLALIEAWVPIIAWLGGDLALLHTIQAVDDVGSLWP